MSAGFERRLAKLEGALPTEGAVRGMTHDELNARILELARKAEDTDRLDPEFREQMRAKRLELEDDIRRQAARHRDPSYQRFLADLEAQDPHHVPTVFGADTCGMSEYGGRYPREMERRAVLRARPDIAALIAEGMSA